MAAAPIIGIDFGTANSVVAVYQEQEQWPEVILNDIGNRSTPSVVAVQDAGGPGSGFVVGEAAVGQIILQPEVTLRGVKQILGRPLSAVRGDQPPALGPAVLILQDPDLQEAPRIAVHGKLLTPEEVCAKVLGTLKAAAEQHLEGSSSSITRAVITVPCYFNSLQRQAVKDAGFIAGLEVLLLNDTSAAALMYSSERGPGKLAVIVDMGAGGTSMAVVRTGEGGAVKVLACSGTRLPGGIDVDAAMMDTLGKVLQEKEKKDLGGQERAWEVLSAAWQKAKHQLTRQGQTKALISTFLPGLDLQFEHEVCVADFEGVCGLFSTSLKITLEDILSYNKVAPHKVDDVLLMGRSSRIPLFSSAIRDVFKGKVLCEVINQEEGNAMGAALLGAAHSGALQLKPQQLLQEVSPLQLKISFFGADYESTTQIYDVPYYRSFNIGIRRRTFTVSQRSVQNEEYKIASCSSCQSINIRNILGAESKLFVSVDNCSIVSFPEGEFTSEITFCHFLLRDKLLELRARDDAELASRQFILDRLAAKNDLERLCREQKSELTNLPASEALQKLIDKELVWLEGNPNTSRDVYIAKSQQLQDAIAEYTSKVQHRSREQSERAELKLDADLTTAASTDVPISQSSSKRRVMQVEGENSETSDSNTSEIQQRPRESEEPNELNCNANVTAPTCTEVPSSRSVVKTHVVQVDDKGPETRASSAHVQPPAVGCQAGAGAGPTPGSGGSQSSKAQVPPVKHPVSSGTEQPSGSEGITQAERPRPPAAETNAKGIMAAAPIIGIDFGTANSVVAVYQEEEQWPEVILNDISYRSTPSVVAVQDATGCPGSGFVVGEAAVGQAILQPEVTLRGVKQILGRPLDAVRGDQPPALGPALVIMPDRDLRHAPRIAVHNKLLTPEEVCAKVLGTLKDAAEQHLEGSSSITRAVVTVPCYFNSLQRQAVKDAGFIAGLKVLLLNDTCAAALVYSSERGPGKLAVIVDMGAGGTSMAVVRTGEGGAVRVLACSDTRLPGGNHVDAAMMEGLEKVLREKHEKGLSGQERAREVLSAAWQKAKQKLTRQGQTKALISTFLPGLDLQFEHEVRVADFEGVCSSCSIILKMALEDLLSDKKVAPHKVDDVLLMGRSSRIPLFSSAIRDVFNGKPLCKVINQEEGNAMGAALLGAAHSGALQLKPQQLLQEVSPLRLKIKFSETDVQSTKQIYAVPFVRTIPICSERTNFTVCQTSPQEEQYEIASCSCNMTAYQRLSATKLELQVSVNTCGIVTVRSEHLSKYIKLSRFLQKGELPALRAWACAQLDSEKSLLDQLEVKNDLERLCREKKSELAKLPACEALQRKIDDALVWLEGNPNVSRNIYRERYKEIDNMFLKYSSEVQQRSRESVRTVLKSNANETAPTGPKVPSSRSLVLNRVEQFDDKEPKTRGSNPQAQHTAVGYPNTSRGVYKTKSQQLQTTVAKHTSEAQQPPRESEKTGLKPDANLAASDVPISRSLSKGRVEQGEGKTAETRAPNAQPLAVASQTGSGSLPVSRRVLSDRSKAQKAVVKDPAPSGSGTAQLSDGEDVTVADCRPSADTKAPGSALRASGDTPDRQERLQPTHSLPEGLRLNKYIVSECMKGFRSRLQEWHSTCRRCSVSLTFPISARCMASPGVEHLMRTHLDAALECMKSAALQRVMAEVRQAGSVALLLDTLASGAEEHIAMMLRYVDTKGNIAERLVCLVESTATVHGYDLYSRFDSLCRTYHLDWKNALRSVSMDAHSRSQSAYNGFYNMLRRGIPHLPLVWNAAHRLEDIISQAFYCCPEGFNFNNSFAALRKFFSEPGHAKVLQTLCGKDVVTETYLGSLWFFYSSFHETILVLKTIAQVRASSAFEAASLLQEIEKGAGFGIMIALSFTLLAQWQVLCHSLSTIGKSSAASGAILCFLQDSSLFELHLDTFTENFNRLNLGISLTMNYRTIAESIAEAVRGKVEFRLKGCLPFLREVHRTCVVCEGKQVDFPSDTQEMKNMEELLSRSWIPCVLNADDPGDTYLARLLKKYTSPQLRQWLVMQCTVPLFATGSPSAFAGLQRCLEAARPPCLEAAMIVHCSSRQCQYSAGLQECDAAAEDFIARLSSPLQ